MKQRYCLVGAAILAALSITILFLSLPTSAAQTSRDRSEVETTDVVPPRPMDYLIALPVAPPHPGEIPSDLAPEEAAEHARSLTLRLAQPILGTLKQLRAEGEIAGFDVEPDLHGVVVEGPSADALEELSHLQGVDGVLQMEDEAPACAVAAAEALADQLLGLSQTGAKPAGGVNEEALAPQATDPSIRVYASPGSTFSGVRGEAGAETTVTMRIMRRGRVVATDSTTSSSWGYYYFYPSWQRCPTSGYTWTVKPGDVVEVTADGNTVSTVVAEISAWVDPDADVVAGVTDAGRSVDVELFVPHSDDPCYAKGYDQTVEADSDGSFSADFSGEVDFRRGANANVYACDENGNSTYAYFYPYRVAVEFDGDHFWGYLKPEIAFSATLSRTGSFVAEYSGRTDASGYYYGWFGETVESGDAISVSGGGVQVDYTATSLDVGWNYAANRAEGTSGAYRVVRAFFYKSTWGDVTTSCSSGWDCNSGVADGSGEFVIPTELDLVRGDYAYFNVYDEEENYQSAGRRYVPVIVSGLSWNDISGYWGDPAAGYVTVTLKDSGGAVKETDPWVGVDSWDGGFDVWMGSTITPTDMVEVSDGAITETMTVQNLTARLHGDTGHLTGSAPNGHLLAELWDFRRDSAYRYRYCSQTNVSNGAYDLTFGGAEVGGQDYAEVWSAGPDDHYTYRHPRAFTVNAHKGDDHVRGYSETPRAPITVTLQGGGGLEAVYTTTSSGNGYYYAHLSWHRPVTITQGDTVGVETGDGDRVDLSVPELTVNADADENRLYGRSPASEPVRPEVERRYNWGRYSLSLNTIAESSGGYAASFDGQYWYRDCSPVDVGHRCVRPIVWYYNAAGHQVWLEGPEPEPVGPDLYESDNISSTATAYDGVQSHTFHDDSDTDWVSFTVPEQDVGSVAYRIETFNLGWGMGTRARLYDDDMDFRGEWSGYESPWNPGQGIRVLWTPSAAGTYYLEISPPGDDHAGYCDAVYDLRILPVRGQLYLPLVTRSY